MLSFKHRVNEGMHIEGNGISIDVIVVAKGGENLIGEACLEIIGVEGVDKMCLAPSERLVHLGEDIYLGVLRREGPNRRTNWGVIRKLHYDGQSSEKIRITYDIPRDFKWELRKYG